MHPEDSKWIWGSVEPKFWASRRAVVLSSTMNSELHLMDKAMNGLVDGFFSQLSAGG